MERETEILARRLRRSDVLKLGAVAAGSGILAACGSGGEGGGGSGGGGGGGEKHSIANEPADLEVFEWAGYEYPTYGGKKGPLDAYVAKYGKPKFTFLTSDDQALGKVRAGYRPDLVHPCVDYLSNWVEMGVVQPWDTSLIPSFKDLLPDLVKNGQVDGKQYFVPLDWGFSAPMYREDKVQPEGEPSWTLMYDERYKGKISWWDSPLENFVIWGYVNKVSDPWNMSDDELDEAKDFLISKKHLVRNFWASQTDFDNDWAAGNIWIAYAWGGSYTAAKDKDIPVVYPDPVEGRLAWNCGMVLIKDTPNYVHAHKFADAWASAASAQWIIPNYAYGHANTKVDLSKVPKDLVDVFHLDDPAARQEPQAHYANQVPSADRARYAKRWDEVKAA